MTIILRSLLALSVCCVGLVSLGPPVKANANKISCPSLTHGKNKVLTINSNGSVDRFNQAGVGTASFGKRRYTFASRRFGELRCEFNGEHIYFEVTPHDDAVIRFRFEDQNITGRIIPVT